MPHDWTQLVKEWLHGHVGIVPISTVIGFGCPRHTAYRLAHRSEFEIIMPGILRSTHWPLGPAQLMMAACLRNSEALISYTTAAKDWRFRGMPQDDGQVYILVPHGHQPVLPGVVVTQCRDIDPIDIVERADGTRITSPPRTLFDCADLLGPERTGSILEQLINDGSGTFVTHARTFARLGTPSRRGTRVMRQVLDERPPFRAAVQSEMELLVLREIERQGLPRPVVQHWLTLPDGSPIRLDFAWPEKTAGLEVDHPFWHDLTRDSQRDKSRDLRAATIGWMTMRITKFDVEVGLRQAIARVAQALALR